MPAASRDRKVLRTARSPIERENVALRRALRNLSDVVLLSLDDIDVHVGRDRDVPAATVKKLAVIANHLDMANDSVRFFNLGVDRTKDNKTAAVAKLRRAQAT